MNVFLLENFYNPFLKMIHYYDVLDGEIYQNSNKDHFVNLNEMLLEKNPENAKMFQNIYSIFEELKKHNLSYNDAINPNNYGYKNNAYAIFDIGYGDKLNYRVGWNTQNLNDQWKGKIFEIIIFDRILGSDDRVLMQNYFERKYKVQLN